ncbi:M15 family metallopeptidase [Clostridium sp. CX1]|uniref:M15 family metallopeptidase n=1 Tax=Clostridium sp. CX1 TaxID=2978346 RepID=UPI0021BF640D|nr:M15 family metallopeptidase [Clostridium sp. CX1]MCT8977428.1 M15 family metallopeptidase [Clostridium sp. CX1]
MKKITLCIILLFSLCINTSYPVEASQTNNKSTYTSINSYEVNMKQDILSLMMAYPGYVSDIVKEDNGLVYLVMKSGKRILYDDKKIKTYEQKLENPDLQDMMEQVYPLSTDLKLMDKNFDPGRCRAYGILNEVYGSSQQQIQSNLARVNFGYTPLQFNDKNKAAESLKDVMKDLTPLIERNSAIRAAVIPCSGTFNYRLISGTNRLSPHSFGIAIDLARDRRDYWKWANEEQGQKRLDSYPREVVEIFEKNNFIWGGKWGHFDILHFEYRPEIILKARYFGVKRDFDKLWYNGVPLEDVNVKSCVEKINKSLE